MIRSKSNAPARDNFTALEMDDGVAADALSGLPTAAAAFAAPSGTDLLGGFSILSIGAGAGPRPEGNSGATPFTFNVFRAGDLSLSASTAWYVSPSGAAAADGADFMGGVLPSGTVTFAPGETMKTITVQVAGDHALEADETFDVVLTSRAADVHIGTSSATGTILNDDAKALISIHARDPFQLEGDVGAVAFRYDVVREGDASRAGSVDWKVSGTGAAPANAADFVGGVLPSGTVVFAAGETVKTVTVLVAGDRTIEANETFQVAVTTTAGDAAIVNGVATGLIVNDDAKAVVSLFARDNFQYEGDTGSVAFTYDVIRGGDIDRVASVNWNVTGIATQANSATPANGADFVGGLLPSGSLTFGIGETHKTVTVQVAGDRLIESNEAFQVALTTSASDVEIGNAPVQGLIVNDDAKAVVSLFARDNFQYEGDTGSVAFTYDVIREGDIDRVATVNWNVTGIATQANSATPANGADFVGGVLPSGSLTFGIGETHKTVTVQVAGDRLIESNEAFQVALTTSASDVEIGNAPVQGLIVNDDAKAVVSLFARDNFQYEGDTGSVAFTYDVIRGGDIDRVASVNWNVTGIATQANSATPADGADFVGGVLPSGSLTFGIGETHKTVTVLTRGDLSVESNEAFQVALSTSASDVQIASAPVTGLIINDDAPAVLSISAVSGAKFEGDSGAVPFSFNVVRSGDLNRAAFATWHVSGAGAAPANGADFVGGQLPSGTVSFAPGETAKTIVVMAAGDTTVEANESFAVTLTAGNGDTTIANGVATGTILTDDLPAKISIAALHATRAEGDTGATPFTFTVTRTGQSGLTVSASWHVAGGSASPADGTDFAGGILPSGTVTFAPNEFSQTLTVNVAGDTAVEGDDGFVVVLTTPSAGATIGTATAVGVIVNDDFVRTPSIAAGLNFASPAMSFMGGSSGAAQPEAEAGSAVPDAWFVSGFGGEVPAIADFSSASNNPFVMDGEDRLAGGGLANWLMPDGHAGIVPVFSNLG